MRLTDFGLLLLLAAIWGASFLFIRIAAPVLNPVVLVELRVVLAGVTLLGYAAVMHRVPSFRRQWRRYLALSALNAALPFTLVATAALYLTASNVAILNATTALCTAVVAAAWRREAHDRLTPRKVLGLVLGVIGVAVLVGWNPQPLTAKMMFAVGAVLLAALSYAFGAVYPGRYLPGAPPLTLALGQQIGTGLIVLPAAVVTVPTQLPPAAVIASVVALAVVCTAFAYVLYFQLLGRIGPANTSTVTFLVPLFAVLWGVLVLHEPLGLGTVAGLAIILTSVGFVTGVRFGPRQSPMPTPPEPSGAASSRAHS